MPIAFHVPPSKAQVIEVIHVAASRGDGTSANPERIINLYFAKSGELLACHDPLNGPPDGFITPGSGP